MSMLATSLIETSASSILFAAADLASEVAAHPLATAGMFLTIYLGLSAAQQRLQCCRCSSRSDSI